MRIMLELSKKYSQFQSLFIICLLFLYVEVYIQSAIASDSTDGEIGYMYNSSKKTKFIQRYMEVLSLHTGAPTVHWGDNTSFISVVED